jgi:hypothetical protein
VCKVKESESEGKNANENRQLFQSIELLMLQYGLGEGFDDKEF